MYLHLVFKLVPLLTILQLSLKNLKSTKNFLTYFPKDFCVCDLMGLFLGVLIIHLYGRAYIGNLQ